MATTDASERTYHATVLVSTKKSENAVLSDYDPKAERWPKYLERATANVLEDLGTYVVDTAPSLGYSFSKLLGSKGWNEKLSRGLDTLQSVVTAVDRQGTVTWEVKQDDDDDESVGMDDAE